MTENDTQKDEAAEAEDETEAAAKEGEAAEASEVEGSKTVLHSTYRG